MRRSPGKPRPIVRLRSLDSKTPPSATKPATRSEEHTSELQSRPHLVCRLLLEKKKKRLSHSLHYRFLHTSRPPSQLHSLSLHDALPISARLFDEVAALGSAEPLAPLALFNAAIAWEAASDRASALARFQNAAQRYEASDKIGRAHV